MQKEKKKNHIKIDEGGTNKTQKGNRKEKKKKITFHKRLLTHLLIIS